MLEVGEGYLALEWIEPGRLDAAGEEELGRGLARDARRGRPALRRDRRLRSGRRGFGSLRLPNEPAGDWASFYAERRLRPLAARGRASRARSRGRDRAVEGVCERMGELAGPAEPPARLHGDLWTGNVLADRDGRPWLIDPSAYGGHREVDLAMLRLFGAPSERVFDAYEEVAPLAEGWRERVELYQLLAAARARAAVRRLLRRRRPSAARCELRRLTARTRGRRPRAGREAWRPVPRCGRSRWVCASDRLNERRRLYLLARVVVARHYRGR